ncbi:MAG: helix-turn-helix domain-containing protein [Anaerolineae bacterium]
MKAYSADLRERVIAAVRDANLPQPEIAETFGVSLSCVEKWWRIFRNAQRTAPLPHAGGARRLLQPHAAVIRHLVAHQPDATLEELCTLVAAQTGVQANPSMMCRELHRLQLPRKKVVA